MWFFALLACGSPSDSSPPGDSGCTAPATWYADVDGDGYGDPGNPYVRCDQPTGFVAPGEDCDDNDPAIHPGLPFYADNDGDGYGDPLLGIPACQASIGVVASATDCDDSRADAHPGGQERCDGEVDEDCDGLVDGADPSVDVTGEPLWYPDADGDDHGVPEEPIQACGQPEGYAPVADDCDDDAASAWPGAPELCGNGTDDNCNGEFDGCGLSGTVSVEEAALAIAGSYDTSFGWAVLGLPDLDGDALPELAVSAPAEAAGGVVRVFRSSAEGWISTGDAGSELTSDRSDGSFGYRIATGDVDGDGLGDLVVADPEYTSDTGAHAGRVAVFLAPLAAREDASAADLRRTGSPGDRYSAQLGLGDWDGDGAADVVSGGLSTGDGAVRIETDPLGVPDARASDRATATILGDWTAKLASGGDLDGDGSAEVALSAGATLVVVTGGWTGSAAAEDFAIGALTAGGQVLTMETAADVDGDGRADLLVGAASSALVFLAPLSAILTPADASSTWTDETTVEGFGTTLALLGDEDADGDADLLIGAYAADDGENVDVGAAFLFHAPFPAGTTLASAADARILGREESSLAGWAVAAAGDRDGDGRADLAVGAPGSAEAYVIAGGGF